MAKRILFAAPWWHEGIMHGLARQAARRGWHLNLEPALSGGLPVDWRGDGIVTTLGGDIRAFARFRAHAGCPAVSLSLNVPEIDIPRVGIDNRVVGRMAADHLLERMFTSYLFYARSPSHAGRLRCDAFADCLAGHGHELMRLDPEDVESSGAGHWSRRQERLARVLQQIDTPAAVFAQDDASAVEVIEACQNLGLAVPEQVGVLGVLDMPLFRESTTVPISSIRVDFDAYTQTACDLLESLMAGGESPGEPVLLPPVGVIARDSTDTIAARQPAVARTIHYMMQHYAEPIPVADMVAVSGTSQTGLYAAFNKDVGQSPGAVLTRIRLEKVKRRLRETDEKIEAVAEACGFRERITLYRQFKQHVGMSPNAYRKRAAAGGGVVA